MRDKSQRTALLVVPLLSLVLTSALGRPWARQGAAGVEPPPKAARKSCQTSGCHEEYRGLSHLHGPVAVDRCLACHEPDEDATPYEAGDDHCFELVARDGRLCLRCHESQAAAEHVHYPIRRHKCLACHDPHGSDNTALLRHAVLADNCYECHEKTESDEPHVHSPVALGQCTTCHDPHASPYPKQLVAPGSALCLRCHVEVGTVLETRSQVHRPVAEDCNGCHDPHDGPDRMRLRKPVPELCFGCHEDVAAAVRGPVEHGALAQGRSCLYCHEPHAADYSRLLRDVPKTVCLSCHDRPLVTPRGVIADMKGYLERNRDQHGPVREGDCGACHDPHGAPRPSLLREPYPPEFYAPFDEERYRLCFTCHEKSLVEDRETETLTGFRNGKKNLHYVHVHRARKGRTCRACHDVHATNHPKHITDAVPFGPSWSYEIRYEQTENGGRCAAACHRARGYDRIQPVKNR